MKYARLLSFIAILALLAAVPVSAQDAAPSVLILPVNHAEFLPGAWFDLRIEVEADALPDDFSIAVNGINASDFFGAESTVENWEVGADTPVTVSAATWRGVTLPETGDYTVEVTADGVTESVTWTTREPQAGTAKNVILFIADGMTVAQLTAARAARGIDQGRPITVTAMMSTARHVCRRIASPSQCRTPAQYMDCCPPTSAVHCS